jgi:hypothetical protein
MHNNQGDNCFDEFEIARTTDCVDFSSENNTERQPIMINRNTTSYQNMQNVSQGGKISVTNSTTLPPAPPPSNNNNNNNKMSGKELGSIAQKIFVDIKEKRDQDKTRCDEFESCIKIWGEELTKKAIQSLEYHCDKNYKIIKEYFMEIEKDLHDIGKMEMELGTIQTQVEALYQQTRV